MNVGSQSAAPSRKTDLDGGQRTVKLASWNQSLRMAVLFWAVRYPPVAPIFDSRHHRPAAESRWLAQPLSPVM